MIQARSLPTNTFRTEFDINIDATVERVWHALTTAVDDWWLPDFRVAGPGSALALDPRPGGSLLEQSATGGTLWFTVQACVPGQFMTLHGTLSHATGPGTTTLELALRQDGDGCVLTVTDVLLGNVTGELAGRLAGGWATLFRDGLKAHVEAGS